MKVRERLNKGRKEAKIEASGRGSFTSLRTMDRVKRCNILAVKVKSLSGDLTNGTEPKNGAS